MDQAIRNRLRSVVTQCRKLLEEAVSQVLQGQFGIHATGKKEDVQVEDAARMGHLSQKDRQHREQILVHLDHIQATGFKPQAKPTHPALDQLIREIAFTHLNRLCAYKMMENQGLIREAVSRGLKSQGFLFYLADHDQDEKLHNAGHQDVAYRHFLNWLGGTLSEEIGVLFSPHDSANRLFPPQRVLDDVLGLLNSEELKDIWTEDEAIGWVYQYFTPKELRDQARKESRAPRNSYELAFRNQFFTPRYVVEFLTDNTLGRTWYEMRRGDTRLKDHCRYLVRRPSEVFLKKGETAPPTKDTNEAGLSQEELLRQPVYIQHRPKKDPREIKVLDPACGSGHFLLYCFDLLLVIYEEAYDDLELGEALQKDYPRREEFRKAVPGLILSGNLHGIDIDRRATQIAALALWLRAQRAYQEMGLKRREDRPRITRSNIVCAEPMPGERDLLDGFLKSLHDDRLEALIRRVMHVPEGTRVRATRLMADRLCELVEAVWDKMRLAGEAGSLLKIESELQEAIRSGQEEWEEKYPLFHVTEFNLMDVPTERYFRFVPGDIEGQRVGFWDMTERLVLAALEDYAQAATGEDRFKRHLFVEDAAHGLGFIDVCRQQFDVVLMNPPFGWIIARASTKRYLERAYPDAWTDYFLSFIERARGVSTSIGMVGAVIPDRFLDAKKARVTRNSLCTSWPASMIVDCGRDVMDEAAVDAVLLVVPSYAHSNDPSCFFVNIKSVALSERAESLAHWANQPQGLRSLSLFQNIPGTPFAYSKSRELLFLWRSGNRLDPDYASVATGGKTFDDERFLRLRWEVGPDTLQDRWLSVDTGGDYQPWISPPIFTEDWQSEGKAVRENAIARYGTDAQVMQSSKYWFKPGLAFPITSSIGFGPRIFPAGSILSTDAVAISPKEGMDSLLLLGAVASSWAGDLLTVFGEHRKTDNSSVKSLPLHLSENSGRDVIQLAESAVCHVQRIEALKETSAYFVRPPKTGELGEIAEALSIVQRTLDDVCRLMFSIPPDYIPSVDNAALIPAFVAEPDKQQHEVLLLSYLVGTLFGRWDVRFATGERQPPEFPDPFDPLPLCSPGMLTASDGLPAEESPPGYPLRIEWDGIMVDDVDQHGQPAHPSDIVRRVRETLELIWKDRADAIEKEVCDILGVKELRDYFRKSGSGGFWDHHVKRYSKSRRKAPIYWLLQSSKKNYALWLYYHRLDKDVLFKALLNYVQPKIRLEQSRLDSLRSQKTALGAAKGAKKIDKEIERQDALLVELKDFEEKLRRAANLDFGKNLDSSVIYDPDLNDGVVLNIAPLWELVPWKEAKGYWDELLAGEYEWSSMSKLLRKKGLVK